MNASARPYRPTIALTPADVAAIHGVHRKCVREWITVGIRLPDGTRVRLKANRVASRWRIEPADLEAFLARCTAGALPPAEGVETAGCPVPGKDVRRRLAAADARLKARGL